MQAFWNNYRAFRKHVRGQKLSEVKRMKVIVRGGPLVIALAGLMAAATSLKQNNIMGDGCDTHARAGILS